MPNIHIELTDDFKQDQPLAFLVKCLPSCAICEYKIFTLLSDAIRYADINGIETESDWYIYPLYASHCVISTDQEAINKWV